MNTCFSLSKQMFHSVDAAKRKVGTDLLNSELEKAKNFNNKNLGINLICS